MKDQRTWRYLLFRQSIRRKTNVIAKWFPNIVQRICKEGKFCTGKITVIWRLNSIRVFSKKIERYSFLTYHVKKITVTTIWNLLYILCCKDKSLWFLGWTSFGTSSIIISSVGSRAGLRQLGLISTETRIIIISCLLLGNILNDAIKFGR